MLLCAEVGIFVVNFDKFVNGTMAHEAKQYAQRNRQGSDWFSHDSNALSSKPACPAPTEPAAPEVTEPPPVSADVVDKSPTVESDPSEPAAAAAAVQPSRAQMIKPKCDSNEWFVLSLSLLLCYLAWSVTFCLH